MSALDPSAIRTLAIIDCGPLAGQRLNEALSAIMVLATYGQQVQLLLCGDAVQLLEQPVTPITNHPFKSVYAMIESFEFYDLLPIWISEASSAPSHPLVEYQKIHLNQLDLKKFTHILRWS